MLKRKEKIIISAIELLGEEGISGITIKNIARKQKVTEPALYRQFENKQEILNGIIKEFESYDTRIQDTILQSDMRGKEAVMFYVGRYAELYENYSELSTVILSMDLYYYNEYTRKEMQRLLGNRKKFVEKLVEPYLEEFAFDEQVNAEEISTIICGILMSQIFEWRLKEKSYSLKDNTNKLFTKIL
jgi:AcrR family transcriptional regulator